MEKLADEIEVEISDGEARKEQNAGLKISMKVKQRRGALKS